MTSSEMLELNDRILCPSGISVLSDDDAITHLLYNDHTESIRVQESEDAVKYENKYLTRFSIDIDQDCAYPAPRLYDNLNERFSIVYKRLIESRRDDTTDDDHYARLDHEFGYFSTQHGMNLVVKLDTIISQFREHGVVWGVGRGSSCASYTLYLLGVHDINPLRYDIDFSEFSKQNEEQN